MKYSVFTVVMPEYDPEEAAQKLAEWGFDGVEWRVHEPPPEGQATNYWSGNRATLDVGRIKDMAKDIRKISERHGLAIPGLASYLRASDVERARNCLEAAAIMGAGFVRIGVPGYDGKRNYSELYDEAIEEYSRIEAIAKECKVKAVFEIHMGNICPSASLAHRLASNFDPQYVGAIFDPGNMICEGYENWQMGLELLGPYLAHVHVKNGQYQIVDVTPDGRAVWRYASATMRGGRADWRVVLGALRKVGYDGWMSLEDFSSVEPTEKKLPNDLAFLKELEQTLS